MALRNIDNEVMLQLSATWLDAQSEAHLAVMNLPDLAAMLPRVQLAHSSLAALLQPAGGARIAAISAEEASIDLKHDSLIRGAHGLLDAMAEIFGGDAGAAIRALQELLLPEGLSSMQKSYRAEAGQAAQLKNRITTDVKAKLESVTVTFDGQTKKLADIVDAWIALGKKLGELEDEKARLQDSPDESTAMATLKARNLWIRTVNAFLANAELAEIHPDADRLIFGPLRAAERAAARRTRGRSAEGQAEPDTAGAGGQDPTKNEQGMTQG